MKAQSEGVSNLYSAFTPTSTALKKAINRKKRDLSPINKLKPLEFRTGEELGSTPAIFQSLSTGNFGPQTFVCDSNSCPTFVIADSGQYPSYVIDSVDVDSGVDLGRKDESPSSSPNGHAGNNNDYFTLKNRMTRQYSDELDLLRKQVDNYESILRSKDEELSRLTISHSEMLRLQQQVDQLSIELKEKETELSRLRDHQLDEFQQKNCSEVDRLQTELEKALKELRERDGEVEKLVRLRSDGERELEDLTASLFQEAHKMVRIANEKQAAAEKALTESRMKVEVLSAEVAALKTLVLTSTPSMPNPHLHPQINGKKEEDFKKHRRSPSHFNLKYGRESSLPDSPVEEKPVSFPNCDTPLEMDPVFHKEFLAWREHPKSDKSDPFLARIYREDIDLCMDFTNQELAEQVLTAVERRDIYVEAVSDKAKIVFPRKCALLEVNRQCHYRMRLGDQETWYSISHICRNRITAVCDFLNYLRYIELGLVKTTVNEVYWEIVRLRKEMVLARLGLSLST